MPRNHFRGIHQGASTLSVFLSLGGAIRNELKIFGVCHLEPARAGVNLWNGVIAPLRVLTNSPKLSSS
ncbi:hypothetical protein [Lyngbya sp. CCY1209]|uniref:hypothetical protein n=1 Tax=Lyngbya sp. CCY1209 TaxID=2886103 RepID=UPI002D213B4C|nr:hypothetical protein [Lyngbya sp. CCY1209]MEB3884520.1 hypothetical protein [Lyngbya sp. CCY1209]